MNYFPYIIEKNLSIKSLISIFKYSYGQNYYYKGETHNFWEVMIILEGYAYVAIDENIYKVEKGEMIFIKPNLFHNLQSRDCKELKILIMSFEMDCNIPIQQTVFKITDNQSLEFISILQTAKNIFNFDGIFVKTLNTSSPSLIVFVKRLELLIGNIITTLPCEDKNLNTPSAKIYSKIIQYINGNLSVKFTLAGIAKVCNVSPSYIKKVFKLYSNETVMSYVSNLKISKAKELLQSGLPSKSVSNILGYNDQNYFSSHFKKLTGMSPKKWLKSNI